jgi:hypothetical protein
VCRSKRKVRTALLAVPRQKPNAAARGQRAMGKVLAGLVLCAMVVVWLVVTLADLPYHQYSELPSPTT